MSESGGESLFSSVGSWSEDFSSNGENDFGTSDFERESSDANPGLTDDEDEGSDDEQMDDDREANDVEVEIQDERIHLEDVQLIPGLVRVTTFSPTETCCTFSFGLAFRRKVVVKCPRCGINIHEKCLKGLNGCSNCDMIPDSVI